MTYKYKCGKDIINVFVWSDDFHTDVAIYDKEAARSYDRTIREDKKLMISEIFPFYVTIFKYLHRKGEITM